MTTAAELASYASSFPSFRNRIINGDMRIDQRNAGASITATNGHCLDRWTTRSSQSSKYSVEQSTDSPNSFNYSLKVTSLSSYSITSSDYFTIDQRIETGNIQDFAWGNASGKSAILSFWVKSSLTGTFSGSISNYNGNPTYGFTYQISIADTWEKKVISIPCPTIGSWSNTLNDGYVSIAWGFGVGDDEVSTSNNSWLDENKRAGSGGVSIVGTSGATWYITGVQLEEGTVATPFEHRPYGTELSLCQRYYYIGRLGIGMCHVCPTIFDQSVNDTPIFGPYSFPVDMRATPTMTVSGTVFIAAQSGVYGAYNTLLGASASNNQRATVYGTDNSNYTNYLDNNRALAYDNRGGGNPTFYAYAEL